MVAHASPEPANMAMPQTVPWTREDLARLPDDGNRYEVLGGALLVTPPPSDVHQEIVAWLSASLTPFVMEHALGLVHHPRSVVVIGTEQLEPDLMVRPIAPLRGWEHAPRPILVVEILSRSTRRRDLEARRRFYMRAGIAEYWIVDRHARAVLRCKASGLEERVTTVLTWSPDGAGASLDLDLAALFARTEARDPG